MFWPFISPCPILLFIISLQVETFLSLYHHRPAFSSLASPLSAPISRYLCIPFVIFLLSLQSIYFSVFPLYPMYYPPPTISSHYLGFSASHFVTFSCLTSVSFSPPPPFHFLLPDLFYSSFLMLVAAVQKAFAHLAMHTLRESQMLTKAICIYSSRRLWLPFLNLTRKV